MSIPALPDLRLILPAVIAVVVLNAEVNCPSGSELETDPNPTWLFVITKLLAVSFS
jgi:hypothetical protein